MTEQLPRWDTTHLAADIEHVSVARHVEHVEGSATRLIALFDEHHVRTLEPRLPNDDDIAIAERIIGAVNDHRRHAEVIGALVHAYVTTDGQNETARKYAARLATAEGRLRALMARLAEWLAVLEVDALTERSSVLAEHRGPLRRLAERADHQMSESDEALYIDLLESGSRGWQQLYADVTSRLTAVVTVERDETLPIATVRGLASHPDAVVRRAALAAEIEAWASIAVPCAAALNGIKGEAIVVNRRRRWDDPIDASMFANGVSAATFAALQRAVVDVLPDFRRFLNSKARLHGDATGLHWADLMAPLPSAPSAPVHWTTAIDTVSKAFDRFGQPLRAVAERMVQRRWIDAEPRAGKRGGAFCMPTGNGNSLILMNWSGGASSTLTLAHELGHAYHNVQLGERTPLQRQLPMTLAETASIFCETLVTEHCLEAADGIDELSVLDVDLSGSTQLVVDIHSRYLFERELFARRTAAPLSPDTLCLMMLDAQHRAYGDSVVSWHEYMWAVKPHYYNSHFYNWPYTFGLLFGLGLFAAFQTDPERFVAQFDDLLSRVGIETAEPLATEFGIDLTSDDFWRSSTEVLRRRIDRYVELARQ